MYNLSDFFTDPDENFALSATPIGEESALAVFDKDDFYDALEFKYGERYIYVKETETPKSTFKRMFDSWKRRRGVQIATALNTLLKEYNPIENYNSVEEHTGDDTTTKTPEDWTKTTTQTPTNWKEEESFTNYKETETQTPTNWKEEQTFTNYAETETQTPTNWKSTQTETPTDWTITETQTPTNWEKTTTNEPTTGNNNSAESTEQYYPFNSSDPVNVSKRLDKTTVIQTEAQAGTFETTREQTGTNEIEVEQSGTFENKKEIEGSKAIERKGTYETEKEFTGSKSVERTGTFETTEEQTGTFEDKTEYNSKIEKHGNIGVMSSQQMLIQELQVRRTDFIDNVLAEFFNQYTIYC